MPHGALLTKFAEAVLGDDDQALDEVRGELCAALGDDGLVDTAGIVSTFNGIDRVADACGIPLEDERLEMTAELRAQLRIDDYVHEEESPSAAE